MGCSGWAPRGFPAAAPPKEAWVVSPWPPPAQPYLPVGPVQLGKEGLSPICLRDSSQDEWGEDTNPTETIKTMQPHKSPSIESVS